MAKNQTAVALRVVLVASIALSSAGCAELWEIEEGIPRPKGHGGKDTPAGGAGSAVPGGNDAGVNAGSGGEGGISSEQAGTGGSAGMPGPSCVCPQGSFDDDDNPSTACRAWSNCKPGESIAIEGTSTTDRQCQACESGTYCDGGLAVKAPCASGTWDDDANSATKCVAWRTCTWALGGDASPGTATSDKTCGTPSPYRWFRSLSSDRFAALTADADGSIYAAGYSNQKYAIGSFAYKFDATGASEWQHDVPAGYAYVNAIALDTSGYVYSGGATSPFGSAGYVAKWDVAGAKMWDGIFNSPAKDNVQAVAFDSAGNVYLAGATYGELLFPNPGGADGVVRKYDSQGVEQWTRQFSCSDSGDVNAFAIVIDDSGSVYVAGNTSGTLDSANAGGTDLFLTKYDAAGTPLWTRQFGTSGYEAVSALTMASDGSVLLAGFTSGSLVGTNAGDIDAFLGKYSADGALQWINQFGTVAADQGNAVAVDSTGNIYVAGTTSGALNGPNAGQADAFVRKFLADGTAQWTEQFGSSDTETVRAVAADHSGNVYVAGSSYGSLDGTNAGSDDAFVRQIPAP
jgi:hypothetical protein